MADTLTCPICTTPLTTAGRTDRCKTCDGAWIHEDTLVGMLQETASAMVFLPWHARPKDQERACAVCKAAMAPVSLGDVALDRCAEHGVWFDATELAAVIAQAKQFKAQPKDDPDDRGRQGLLGALAKLFG
jgi:Zn-finger nucleic acid-binding protein